MIGVSSGTASVLGLKKIKTKAPPTTAYLMLGNRCTNNCKFCSQAHNTCENTGNTLSRVDWPEYDMEVIKPQLEKAYLSKDIKRLCLQVVDGKNAFHKTFFAVSEFSKLCNIPICASSIVKSVEEANILFDAGLERLCYALDAASFKSYSNTKEGNFDERINFLCELAKKFPGKITTHLIVGLGEHELDLVKIISLCCELNITVALFAFTPLKGTPMQNVSPPPINVYRKIQIIYFLLQKKIISVEDIVFDDGRIIAISKNKFSIARDAIYSSNGIPFMTSGCSDCNRPYYNESPSSVPYNYPYKPDEMEIKNAILISGLL